MAAIETTRSLTDGHLTGGRLVKFFHTAYSAFAEWNDARKTRAALSRLTNYELEDIGLVRGDIHTIK